MISIFQLMQSALEVRRKQSFVVTSLGMKLSHIKLKYKFQLFTTDFLRRNFCCIPSETIFQQRKKSSKNETDDLKLHCQKIENNTCETDQTCFEMCYECKMKIGCWKFLLHKKVLCGKFLISKSGILFRYFFAKYENRMLLQLTWRRN